MQMSHGADPLDGPEAEEIADNRHDDGSAAIQPNDHRSLLSLPTDASPDDACGTTSNKTSVFSTLIILTT